MGCSASIVRTESKPLIKETNEAEKLLQQSREEEKFRFKVLLLGAGESGKSTVVKQIKVIWNVPDATNEFRKYAIALQRNVIEAMQTLLQAAKKLDVPIENPELRAEAERILHMGNHALVTPELAPIISKLWHDPGVRKVYERRSEYWLMDATPYYLDEVMRLAQKDFSPNEDDMIMARIRTTGIVVSEVVEKPYRFEIVDVGGQRSERRKWIHCFDDVKAIIYLASLSGYNQSKSTPYPLPSMSANHMLLCIAACIVLYEDSSENIMNESLKLFDEVVKNPIFKNTPIFVFLNKKDLFEDMIKKAPLKKCFPDYNGPEGEMNPALDFIQQKFRDVLHQHVPGKPLPIHIIAARVRRDMKMAFGEVKDNLKRSAQQSAHQSHASPHPHAHHHQQRRQTAYPGKESSVSPATKVPHHH